MPLSAGVLKQSLASFFEPGTMPTGDVILSWCSVYGKWAQLSIAGAAVLAAPLVPSSATGNFFDALDTAFRTMWMSAVWLGPGVVAATAIVPPLQPFFLSIAPALTTSYDRGLAPTLISEALHTYTLGITVSLVPPTGTPIIVSIT